MNNLILEAAELIKNSKHTTAFTGAGISVESGIPPFRGKNGLWSKYDPNVLDLDRFYANSEKAWVVIREIFYDFFGKAKPNFAHNFLARLEEYGKLHAIITQNIDNLHQEGGSKNVYEFHGTANAMVCVLCDNKILSDKVDLTNLPPQCPKCKKGVLKPDFIFFGEGIPEQAYMNSLKETEKANVFIIIGSTGTVMPACMLPEKAKFNGAKIIEINTEPSNFSHSITDIFLQGKATEICKQLDELVFKV